MPTIADYVAQIKINSDAAVKELQKFDMAAKGAVDGSEKRFSKLGNSLKSKLSLAVSGLTLGGIVKEAADIEAGFIGVKKTTGLAADEIKKLKDSLLQFSQQTPVTVNSLIDIAKVAGQLGISGSADIQKFTETFAKLQIASDNTVAGELGAQGFAKFLEATGEGIERAENMASAITFLGNTSKFTEGQLLSVVREVSKLAPAFNLGGAAVLGMSATFQELSIQPEVARTATLNFFASLDKAVRGIHKNENALIRFSAVTGLTAKEIEELSKKTPERVLTKYIEGLGRIKEAGGDVIGELDNVNLKGTIMNATFLALAGSSEKMSNKIDDATNAARENKALSIEVTEASKGFNAELAKLKNSFSGLADTIASSGLLGLITSIVDELSNVVNGAGRAIKALQSLISVRNKNAVNDSDLQVIEKTRLAKQGKVRVGAEIVKVTPKEAKKVVEENEKEFKKATKKKKENVKKQISAGGRINNFFEAYTGFRPLQAKVRTKVPKIPAGASKNIGSKVPASNSTTNNNSRTNAPVNVTNNISVSGDTSRRSTKAIQGAATTGTTNALKKRADVSLSSGT